MSKKRKVKKEQTSCKAGEKPVKDGDLGTCCKKGSSAMTVKLFTKKAYMCCPEGTAPSTHYTHGPEGSLVFYQCCPEGTVLSDDGKWACVKPKKS